MDKKKFFITTPIYYSNGIPHIGHSYASFIADIIAKYKRISWFEVKFSTWVDENSQKVVEKAQEAKMEIMEYADLMASKHKAVWDWLDITYSDFIRTTEPRHKKLVQEVLQKSFDKWDIYQWEYEWLYCVWCEAYKKLTDLNEDWCCPDHLTKPQIIKEKNWFFKLSKYQKELEKFYEENPNFIIPSYRTNEVREFIRWGLEDFSISRESNKFGIPLPFDPTQVTYVWYDALFNYITVCQNWDEDFWPADLHVVGKDIIKFHWIYWPAMLISAWYELPKNILTTWFFTINWQKISKSLWNVIDPVEFSQKYSRDLLLIYLLSAFPIWQDWDFSEEQAITMYNAKLANNLGNLLNRFIVLSLKLWGKINKKINKSIEFEKINFKRNYQISMSKYNLLGALNYSFDFCDKLNKFIDNEKPWNLNINTENDKIEEILYNLWEWLRTIAICLYPFFSEKMWDLLGRIWMDYWNLTQYCTEKKVDIEDILQFWDEPETFTIKEKWEALYPRI